jgi:hypothetical protein
MVKNKKSKDIVMGGVRIRLDLSDFVADVDRFRWIFLERGKFKVVFDLISRIKGEYGECEKGYDLKLYLEEPFCLTPQEDIRVLNDGDLVVCKLIRTGKKRKKDADEEENVVSKKQKRGSGGSAKKAKLPSSSSSSSESEDTEYGHWMAAVNKQQQVCPEKKQKAELKPKLSSSSSSESDFDDEPLIRKKPVEVKEKKEAAKSSSSSETSDTSDSAPIPKAVTPSNTTVKTVQIASTSSLEQCVEQMRKKEAKKKAESSSSGSDSDDESSSKPSKGKRKRKRKRKPRNRNKLQKTPPKSTQTPAAATKAFTSVKSTSASKPKPVAPISTQAAPKSASTPKPVASGSAPKSTTASTPKTPVHPDLAKRAMEFANTTRGLVTPFTASKQPLTPVAASKQQTPIHKLATNPPSLAAASKKYMGTLGKSSEHVTCEEAMFGIVNKATTNGNGSSKKAEASSYFSAPPKVTPKRQAAAENRLGIKFTKL